MIFIFIDIFIGFFIIVFVFIYDYIFTLVYDFVSIFDFNAINIFVCNFILITDVICDFSILIDCIFINVFASIILSKNTVTYIDNVIVIIQTKTNYNMVYIFIGEIEDIFNNDDYFNSDAISKCRYDHIVDCVFELISHINDNSDIVYNVAFKIVYKNIIHIVTKITGIDNNAFNSDEKNNAHFIIINNLQINIFLVCIFIFN